MSQPSAWPTRRDLVVICTAIAASALILGALAMLYYIKRRARNHVRSRPHEDQQSHQESSQLVNLAAAGNPGHETHHEPPFDDNSVDDLISSLIQLGSMIQGHVESNYGLHEGKYDRDNLVQAIAGLPFLKHDAQFLAHLCSAPATRHVAIRHLIAGTVFSAIDFSTFHRHVLLPPPVIAFWENLRSPHGDKKLTEGKSLLTPRVSCAVLY